MKITVHNEFQRTYPGRQSNIITYKNTKMHSIYHISSPTKKCQQCPNWSGGRLSQEEYLRWSWSPVSGISAWGIGGLSAVTGTVLLSEQEDVVVGSSANTSVSCSGFSWMFPVACLRRRWSIWRFLQAHEKTNELSTKVDHHILYNYPRTPLGSMSEISSPWYFLAKCEHMSSGVNIMVARLLSLFLGYMISTWMPQQIKPSAQLLL